MHQYVIGVGSNIEAKEHITSALDRLAQSVRILAITAAKETRPIGMEGAPPFTNLSWLIETPLSRSALKAMLNEIERQEGRIRKGSWENRTLDLDIVTEDGVIIDPDYYCRDWLREQTNQLLAGPHSS